MSEIRLNFDLHRDERDSKCLENIFKYLRDLFGESMFYEVYDRLVYGTMFVERFKCTFKNEKKH